ncbi:YhbY family RNA-binding protein [Candidatus Woesearchaeota archaeon]|nr:YhbY family RNA-binding protein [Candidatus Woesearchaeota archaeon]
MEAIKGAGAMESITQELKKKAAGLEPIIRIGKNGVNIGVIDELRMHLKKRKLVKIRVLRTALMDETRGKGNINRIAEEITESCSCRLVQIIGFNIIVCAEKAKKPA